MSQEILKLETIGKLDQGAVGLMIERALREALDDLEDRGKDGKSRHVLIDIAFSQRANEQVEIDVEAYAKVPKRRAASTVANLRHDNEQPGRHFKLLFQENAPDDPNQRTFDDVENNNNSRDE